MRSQTTQFRLTTAIAVTGLVLGPVVPASGLAQGILPQTAPAPVASETPAGPEVSPPTTVGRLASMQGTVSFHTSDQDNWSPAEVNYPITSGDAFWTQPGAQAGIQVSDTFIGMAPATELDVDTLDNGSFAATAPQGEIFLNVGDLQPGQTYVVQTPRGTVTIAAPGQYEVAAGTTDSPSEVTVLNGAAQVSGSAPIDVAAGQTAVISGDQSFQAQLQPATRDAFLNTMLAQQQQQAPARGVALPAVVQQMPGGSELAGYGTWSSDPSYGQVWYPQVQSGWVPYREGHWAYVAPWGWTWIDSDPWGFAPFHYGRWVFIGDRWAWVPGGGVVAAAPPYPVYAPALVTFFGIGIGVGIAAAALFQRPICWVPLGPGEPWHPWFRASPSYIRNVNIRNVTNITNITRINNTTVNNITVNNFRNARAATVVPASVLATSRPVRSFARPVATTQVAQFRPVVGRPPVSPTTATAGVTPAVARQMHIGAPPPGVAAPARPHAPGPAINPRAVAASRPGQRPPTPTLRTPVTAGTAPRSIPTPEHPSATPESTATAHPGAITGSTFTRQQAGEHPAPLLRTPGSATAGPPPIRHEPGRTATVEPHQASPSLFNAHPAAPAPTTERTSPEHAAPAPHLNEAHLTAPALRSPTPQEHAAAPAVIHPAAPPARVAAPAPRPASPAVHEAPGPAPAPRPEVHAAAPAPRPALPVVHEAPRPEIHAAAPVPRPAPPVVHEAPRPAPAPAPHVAMAPPHPAPAPRPAPQQHQQKRPGEP